MLTCARTCLVLLLALVATAGPAHAEGFGTLGFQSTNQPSARQTASGITLADPGYFSAAAPVLRYVDPALGNDTTCDGKGTGPASGGVPCAWASVQRALDDIPDGFTARVGIVLQPGTFSGTQSWTLAAQQGAATGVVGIEGACNTPQATFSTTNTGTAVVSGGVTKLTQWTFTPTISAGTIPATIVAGDFYLRQNNAAAASLGAMNNGRVVMASTTGGTTVRLTVGSGTAITSNSVVTAPTLCPFSTIWSGNVTIAGNATSGVLRAFGMKFAGTLAATRMTMSGNWFAGSSAIARATALSGTYSSASGVALVGGGRDTNASSVSTSWFSTSQIHAEGPANIASSVFSGTANPKIRLGGTALSALVVFGGAQLTQFITLDFEGSGTAVDVRGTANTITSNGTSSALVGCTGPVMSLEITGSPINMEAGAQWYLGCSLTSAGTYTSASTIKSGSRLWISPSGAWAATNTSTPGSDWTVGAQAAVSTANLPVTDYGSGSAVTRTDTGPAALPRIQGGTGTTTPLASCTLVAGTCAATVSTGCKCFVTPEATLSLPLRCTVSGTTATVTGAGVDVGLVNIWCPVP